MFITPNPSTPLAQHPQAGTKMVCWVWGSVWGLGVDLSARRGCQGCASHPQLLGSPLALVGHHHRADKGHEHHGNESQIHLWRGRVSGQGAVPPIPCVRQGHLGQHLHFPRSRTPIPLCCRTPISHAIRPHHSRGKDSSPPGVAFPFPHGAGHPFSHGQDQDPPFPMG